MEGRMEEKQKVQKQAAVGEQLVLMEPAAVGVAEPPLPRHRIPDFYSDPQGVIDGGNLKVEITKSKRLKATYLGLKLTSLVNLAWSHQKHQEDNTVNAHLR